MAFYRSVDHELCQGDLIDNVPSAHIREPIDGALRPVTLSKGRQGFELLAHPASSGQTLQFHGEGEKAVVRCQISRAVVLSHGCDIDNDKKHRLVALVRPLAGLPEADKAIICQNRNSNYFYLPSDAGLALPEAYVDLRRISCLHPDVLNAGTRLASLTDEAVAALQGQFFLFVTRRRILPDNTQVAADV